MRVERIGHVSRGFEQARRWEMEQYRRMSPEERQRCAKELRERYYGKDCPDVLEAERGR